MIKIALVDDDPIILASVQGILEMEEGLQCVLSSQTIDGFFLQAGKVKSIDLLLLDIDLNGQNSLEYLHRIKEDFPQLKIILLTGFADPEFLLEGMNKGISGYFLKGAEPQKLTEAIRVTMEGGAYLEPRLAGAVVESFRELQSNQKAENKISRLEALNKVVFNRREREVIAGLLEGQSYKEIAADNHLSINTIRHYVKTVYHKLGINKRQELIRLSEKGN
ncbi:MAG: response regulator transcription factor [Phaeodactylibacter sp.]|nr:response regulator transcription factor [Phaeodactylibacter sp.]MCB9299087.1 response regulator transcription factor [Lewinellaceae bacterium]